MLSYRHAFHAGNFADVLKHAVFVHSLTYLLQKEKPLRIIDTHAGAGSYCLADQRLQNREYRGGIGALWDAEDLPPLLADYVAQIRLHNNQGPLRIYPGSPLLAQRMMRLQDQLFLHEIHSTDCRLLRENLPADRRIKIIDADGLQGMQALLPPPDRRALVLIDPSYEIKSDYQQVIRQLSAAYRRFATGTYALWYPVVNRMRVEEIEQGLRKSGIRNIQLFELGVRPDSSELGMTASGMIIVNPPWTLWSALEPALVYLAEKLGEDRQGFYRQIQLVDE